MNLLWCTQNFQLIIGLAKELYINDYHALRVIIRQLRIFRLYIYDQHYARIKDYQKTYSNGMGHGVYIYITLETDFTLVNNLLITTQYIPLLVYMYVLVFFDYRRLM